MKVTFLLAAAGLFLASVSCERHSWDEVKVLHEPHGHGGHHAGGHEGHEGESAEAHGHGEEGHGAHEEKAEAAH